MLRCSHMAIKEVNKHTYGNPKPPIIGVATSLTDAAEALCQTLSIFLVATSPASYPPAALLSSRSFEISALHAMVDGQARNLPSFQLLS